MSGPISPDDEATVELNRQIAHESWERRCLARAQRVEQARSIPLSAAELTALQQLEWCRTQRHWQSAKWGSL